MDYHGDSNSNSNSISNSSNSSIPYEYSFAASSAPALSSLDYTSSPGMLDPMQSVVGIDPSLQQASGLGLYAVSLLDQPQYVQDGAILQPVQPVQSVQSVYQQLGPQQLGPQHHHQQEKQLQLESLQQATSGHKQRYLAVLQRSSPPLQARIHPLELVQRATSHFPPPACPPAMSSHPDHSMFPSYTFLTPNFVAEQTHQRRMRRSRTALSSLQQQQQQQQPASQGFIPSLSPQTTHSTHFEAHVPQQISQPQTPPTLEQQSRKRQRTPPVRAAAAKRARLSSSEASSASGGRASGAALDFDSVQLQKPAPPHPSTNYLPLLGPATPTLASSSYKGKSVASSDLSVWSPPSTVVRDTETDAHQPSSHHAHVSPPAVEEPKTPAITAVYVFLPYGHEAPVVKLLNQDTFAGVIRNLLAMAGAQSDLSPQLRGPADDEMPAWQRIFLQKRAVLRQGVPVFSAQQSFSSFSAFFSAAYPASYPASFSSSFSSPQLPDTRLLISCVNMFSVHIMGVYPVVPRLRLQHVVTRFLGRYGNVYDAPSSSTTTTTTDQLSLVIDLFVLALGSLCWAKLDGTAFEPGPGFFYEAQAILGALTRPSRDNNTSSSSSSVAGFPGLAPSLDLARAYLLAALFCGQMAWLPEATQYIEEANVMLRFLIFQPVVVPGVGPVSLVEQNQRPHALSSRERQLAVLYWTCVQLELEIKSEMGQTPSGLIRYQSLVPVPASDPPPPPSSSEAVSNDWEGHDDNSTNLTAITTQVQLWRCLNTIYEEEFVWQRPAVVVKEAVAKMKQQYEESMAQQPPSPSPPPPDKSLVAARARALYCEGRSYGVLRCLQAHREVAVADMAEVMLCLIDTIHAYHDLAGNRILPNGFGVAMIQCRYLLLLFAASRSLPAAAAVVCDDLISELVTGTLATFHTTAGPPGVMEAARRVLRGMQTMLQPQPQPQPQSQTQYQHQPHQQEQPQPSPQLPGPGPGPSLGPGPGSNSVPGLSLYCPPYATRPDILPAVPTATTVSSSFLSFRTPNTPHCVPSSAYDSPFASPDSPATSCSPSPSSATFAPARRLFGAAADASFTSADSGYVSRPPSFLAPSAPPSPACDMAAFAHHIGLSKAF